MDKGESSESWIDHYSELLSTSTNSIHLCNMQ